MTDRPHTEAPPQLPRTPGYDAWLADSRARFAADCRARLAFDLMSNTWNPVVLWTLRHGPLRPGLLRARIGGISAKVLTETLRRLEYNGLVERRSFRQAPPRVEYGLTDLGRSLLAPIGILGEWAFAHGDDVLAAQDQAEADAGPDADAAGAAAPDARRGGRVLP